MDEYQLQVVDRLARIETKIDAKFEVHDKRLAELETLVPDLDHETRIRKLERMIWAAAGAAAAGGGFIGNLIGQATGV